jgi:hypothetical protein
MALSILVRPMKERAAAVTMPTQSISMDARNAHLDRPAGRQMVPGWQSIDMSQALLVCRVPIERRRFVLDIGVTHKAVSLA